METLWRIIFFIIENVGALMSILMYFYETLGPYISQCAKYKFYEGGNG